MASPRLGWDCYHASLQSLACVAQHSSAVPCRAVPSLCGLSHTGPSLSSEFRLRFCSAARQPCLLVLCPRLRPAATSRPGELGETPRSSPRPRRVSRTRQPLDELSHSLRRQRGGRRKRRFLPTGTCQRPGSARTCPRIRPQRRDRQLRSHVAGQCSLPVPGQLPHLAEPAVLARPRSRSLTEPRDSPCPRTLLHGPVHPPVARRPQPLR